MRPDIQRQVAEESGEERAKCQERRDRVLKYPDIAALLTRAPLSLPDPLFWSGYIPPRYWREKPNDSPVRAQLIAICNMVAKRDEELAAGGAPVAPELATDKQLQILHICLDEYGIRDKPEKLMYLSAEVGRTIHESSRELSGVEVVAATNKLRQLIKLDNAPPPTTSEVTGDTSYEVHDQARPGPAGGAAPAGDADDGPAYDGSAEDEYGAEYPLY